ncbi:hypothetical protein EDD75_1377 [Thermodesulfitimonas autotrophica]|uniref:Uncharacterized protein n=1 Tax=Thermodesulfitimonas autotrophica TaxID=1894989 RepID=A0A3N5AQE7_9THEO|nr:hypothetical protein [Thermodesulfitimonas autotrophica]RPF47104.1 hypothetical protein EDD75_1377 [Thermodesulfitimonas autotrophica]
MKRAWIIPAVMCLLLLAAWPFRWEKGPTQTVNNGALKIVHLRDHWTGQAWVALYGYDAVNNRLYSGEMVPVPSQADIAKRKEQILASPEEVKKVAELRKRLTLPAISGGGEEAEWEIQKEEERIESTARSELKCWAWRKRNIATEIWAGLVALSALMAVILVVHTSRSPRNQEVSTLPPQ